uniref:Glycine-rich RNA-binding protein GRP1A-like n=1 Tax=Nicotiana sylvestris TaxID=4096 RepID=A0A1U7XR43_NICSY|nr:PREDICTED: glycine-rich RNA-binding protein GRP1A-like [Nicotiana sylvestris]
MPGDMEFENPLGSLLTEDNDVEIGEGSTNFDEQICGYMSSLAIEKCSKVAAKVEYSCFIGGLTWATTDRTLADTFGTYGEVLDSKIINDRETGRSRGFGFVTFKDEKCMRDAIEGMNGQELDDRNITVNEAQARGSGGGGGGYGGG